MPDSHILDLRTKHVWSVPPFLVLSTDNWPLITDHSLARGESPEASYLADSIQVVISVILRPFCREFHRQPVVGELIQPDTLRDGHGACQAGPLAIVLR